jgi:hypothetical protein
MEMVIRVISNSAITKRQSCLSFFVKDPEKVSIVITDIQLQDKDYGIL